MSRRSEAAVDAAAVFDDVVSSQPKDEINGTGIHPGAVKGYLVSSIKSFESIRQALGSQIRMLSMVYWTDEGHCDDLSALSHAVGFVCSNASPNSWCAVQSKSESLPTVIGLPEQAGGHGTALGPRMVAFVLSDGSTREVEIEAHRLSFPTADGGVVEVDEGDVVTVDGTTGRLLIGDAEVIASKPRRFYRALAEVVSGSIRKLGPVAGWTRLRESNTYLERRDELVELFREDNVRSFVGSMAGVRNHSFPRPLGTVHTVDAVIETRLFYSDIALSDAGELVVVPPTGAGGIGLMRTERLFREDLELDALRVALLGTDAVAAASFERSLSVLEEFLTREYTALLLANSGCMAVVRTLCVPTNKLFHEGFDWNRIGRSYEVNPERAERVLASYLREGETFHGCRGMRMAVQRPDLTRLEIRALLRAAATVMAAGGEADVFILLSMVTLPEEVDFFIAAYDAVYDELLAEGLEMPRMRLSSMVETSAIFHEIEQFAGRSGRHIELSGFLFGGNDFTSATLNMSRADSVRNIIPAYAQGGLMRENPFITPHDVVARTIGKGIRRIRDTEGRTPIVIGFGGEQAADTVSIRRLQSFAHPKSLDYVATSPDRIPRILLSNTNEGASA